MSKMSETSTGNEWSKISFMKCTRFFLPQILSSFRIKDLMTSSVFFSRIRIGGSLYSSSSIPLSDPFSMVCIDKKIPIHFVKYRWNCALVRYNSSFCRELSSASARSAARSVARSSSLWHRRKSYFNSIICLHVTVSEVVARSVRCCMPMRLGQRFDFSFAETTFLFEGFFWVPRGPYPIRCSWDVKNPIASSTISRSGLSKMGIVR